jgi:CDP-diacylglycerol---serine O-phosphatidyltransferase
VKLSRALFVLPTLFTLTSVFLGLLSLVSSATGQFGLAALAILFAALFDMLDGKVARLTRTQSEFGIQIDSLADVVSFGVAPATLVYLALLKDKVLLGSVDVGLLVVFAFLAAGAIRLARYNVDANRKPASVKQFTGLPIPMAAGFMAGLIFGLDKHLATLPTALIVVFMVLLTFLMVSTVKYRKKVNIRSADSRFLLLMLGILMVATAFVSPRMVCFSFFAYYVTAGLAESTLRKLLHSSTKARREESRKRKAGAP